MHLAVNAEALSLLLESRQFRPVPEHIKYRTRYLFDDPLKSLQQNSATFLGNQPGGESNAGRRL
jgi:hypothetical protein